MSTATIHLAFGPVQEFLSQARRTRDLWAGSYLLSFLAANALVAAERRGGTTVLPAVDDNPLVQALRASAAPPEQYRRVGAVPHVAELQASAEQAGEVARAAVRGWQAAWGQVAAAARAALRRASPDWTDGTDALWQQQVDHLWSATWVVGDVADLARRKTLRAFHLPDEVGEMCTCCGARAALRGDHTSRQAVRQFWAALAAALPRGTLLPEGRERLCAVCAVKRCYPIAGSAALGWQVPEGYPSTSTMASLPWRLAVLQAVAADDDQSIALGCALIDYCNALHESEVPSIKALTSFPGLTEVAARWKSDEPTADAFLSYDGDWFFRDQVRARLTELPPQRANLLLESLRRLNEQAGRAGLGPPGTLYALLAMDGDRMGRLLAAHAADKTAVSRALAAFSQQVAAIVEGPAANGRLIYAGGDDVLALLPSTTALATAEQLRTAYQAAFREHLPAAFDDEVAPSISAGLVYAHLHAPLREVVRAAHTLLEADAKRQMGRDAIAVAVWQRSGQTVRLGWKWDTLHVAQLDALVEGIARGAYARRFLYNLLLLLQLTASLSPEDEAALLAAEYRSSAERAEAAAGGGDGLSTLQQLCRVGDTNGALVRLALALASRED